MQIFKNCKDCGESKESSLFNYVNKSKGITKPYCKSCESKKNQQSYLQNRESRLQSSKGWKANNKQKIQEYNKSYYEQRKSRIAPGEQTENRRPLDQN